ncbi:MAG: SMC family ATPase [Caldilineaceae bacterium]|nr:SMC family ATPase [Caldilineaceae bacterium]
MQILSLELENAKSFANTTIDFTGGINAIVGHNGAGKSTILEAIGFSLFDSLEYTHAAFVREGARSATVTTTFASNLDERPYQAVRRCGSSNQYYIHDPELGIKICEGKADVLSFLRQHMGLEPGADLNRLFRDAVGVPQGTLTAAFLATASDRKRVFDPLLQVEEYRWAFERLRDAVKLLSDRRNAVAVEIAGLQGRVERLPALRAVVMQRNDEIATANREHAQALARLETLQTELALLAASRQRIGELQTRQPAPTNASSI